MKAENASHTSSAETSALPGKMWGPSRRAVAYALFGMSAGMLLLFFIARLVPGQHEVCQVAGTPSHSNTPVSSTQGQILTEIRSSPQTAEVNASEDDSLEESLGYLEHTKEILSKNTYSDQGSRR